MFEVAHVSYNLDGTWTDEVLFYGSKTECQNWLDTHCAVYWEDCLCGGVEKEYWLGNKHLQIFKA